MRILQKKHDKDTDMRKTRLWRIAAGFALAVFLAACGGNGDPASSGDDPPDPAAEMNALDFPGVSAANITTITVATGADWTSKVKGRLTTAGYYVINVTGIIPVEADGVETFSTTAGVNVSLRGSGTLSIESSPGTGSLLYVVAGQTLPCY
jgi:PBP1b-binding outer membrane lipoprotein LpoB